MVAPQAEAISKRSVMGIGIYTAPGDDNKISSNQSYTNPLGITFDGRSGGTKEIRLYVRNDDPVFYFSDINLSLQDIGLENVIDRASDGFTWKLSEGDTKPTYNEWANISPANNINFPQIGDVSQPDSSTYLSFWVQISVPPGLDVKVIDTVQFVLNADKELV